MSKAFAKLSFLNTVEYGGCQGIRQNQQNLQDGTNALPEQYTLNETSSD